MRAIGELGVRNLRWLQYHDPHVSGWRVIGRLLRPLETVNAGLVRLPPRIDGAPWPMRSRCCWCDAQVERTFWGWTEEEWIHLLEPHPPGPATVHPTLNRSYR
ncbi:MAG: hypothetical protein EOO27_06075 [Comamonadaceae bacterium]|nr:MAG: hypothetical protein EOO27_06075 [Comamonadaceae bacterium]